MKQVININFHGQIVPIELSAFDLLKQYTASLNVYFANEEGKEEIINDIESRIAELFQERLKKGITCITDEDVNAIIKSMGRPEDFEDADNMDFTQANASAGAGQAAPQPAAAKRLYRDENDKILGGVCAGLANYFGIDKTVFRIIFVILAISFGFGLIPYLILWIAVPSSATKVIGSARKRLFRDPEEKKIAGVCAGIGNYFGINAWIPRVLFLLPFLSFIFRGGDWFFGDFPNVFRGGFSPGAIIIYIILWLVIPEANTTAEKLEMKGEKVDLNSIKNSVVEEMKGVQQRAGKLGEEARAFAEGKGKTIGAEVGSFAKRGGRSLGDIIVLLVKVFVYFILGCIGLALVGALFGFAIISIGVFPLKDYLLTAGWQNALAWGTLIFFIAVPVIGIITWLVRRLVKNKSNSKLLRLTFISLYVVGWACFIFLLASVGKDFKSINDSSEAAIALSNPTVNKLEITTNSLANNRYRNNWLKFELFQGLEEDTVFVPNVSIKIIRAANDSFKVTLEKMANGRTRRAADTTAAMIQYNIQQLDSLLVVDKGIAITKADKFRNQQILITVYVPVGKQIRVNKNVGEGRMVSFRGPASVELEEEERDWKPDTDYIMKADGLYTLNGLPAGVEIDSMEGNITIEGDGTVTEKLDSLKMDMKKLQQQYRDSLIKEQNDIKKKEQENKQKLENLRFSQQATEASGRMLLQSYSPIYKMEG